MGARAERFQGPAAGELATGNGQARGARKLAKLA
jgi:hypothetical protein